MKKFPATLTNSKSIINVDVDTSRDVVAFSVEILTGPACRVSRGLWGEGLFFREIGCRCWFIAGRVATSLTHIRSGKPLDGNFDSIRSDFLQRACYLAGV